MFRDSGGFDRFFPPDDDQRGHATSPKIPNLDTFEKENGFWGRQIKTSLGNTLRLLEPLIILDEGHKAYSEDAENAGGIESLPDYRTVGDPAEDGERAGRFSAKNCSLKR